MAEDAQGIRAQIAQERERLRALSAPQRGPRFDQIRERRNAGASPPALESLVVLHGHVIEAISALSKALREAGGDG